MSFIASGVSAGVGLYQAISGGIKAHKAQKALENLNAPTYTPNAGLSNYYKTALDRFQTNPYSSQQYTVARQNAQRSQAAGLSALGGRAGGAIAGVSRLSAITDDSLLKAGVQAEQQQNQRFGQLGQATQMKAADDKYAFQTNQLMPYQQKYNLLAAKATGGNQQLNAGLSNIYGSATSAGEAGLARSIYGTGGGGLGFRFGGGGGSGGNGGSGGYNSPYGPNGQLT